MSKIAPLMRRSGVDVVAGGQLCVHAVDATGRPDQALAVGVLADLVEDLADGGLDPAVRAVAVRAVPSMVAAGRPGSSPISFSISSTMRWTWLGRSGGLDKSALRVQAAMVRRAPAAAAGSSGQPGRPRRAR